MNDDDPLQKTLARFRNVVPPEHVRDANRKQVQALLERRGSSTSRRPTVAVPLPLALATATVLVLSLAGNLFQATENVEQPLTDIATRGAGDSDATETSAVAKADSYGGYQETQRYLSGIGVVERNIVYWD